MRSVWLFICRFWAFLYMSLSGYKYWSYTYRFFQEGKFKKVKLVTFATLSLVVALVQGGKRWRKDSWRSFGDAVASPQRIQQIFLGVEPQPEYDFDCDDYMSFTVSAIDKSLQAGLMKDDEIQSPRGLTVMWMKGWVAGGHNVTLLEHPQKDGSVLYSYMDYGGPSAKKKSRDEVAALVREAYAPGSDSIAWSVSKPDLTPVETHWG